MIVMGGDYEHTQGLGGSDEDCGGEIRYQPSVITDLYRMILSRGAFEASEFSLANHIMYRDRDDLWLTAIPAFPSRCFRHSAVFVRKDSPLTDFRQLKGRTIGAVEYTMTAAVWVRGHMLEDYDTHWTDVRWVSAERQRFTPPERARVSKTAADLEDLLDRGEIDALLAPKPRDLSKPPAERRFRPLFPEVEKVERDFFRATGLFPIMHTVVIRHDALAKWPNSPKPIFDSYVAAKRRALNRRVGTTFMPWADRHWDDCLNLFGGDPYPYGLTTSNRHNIETLGRFLLEQELIQKPIEIDALFAAGSASWSEHAAGKAASLVA